MTTSDFMLYYICKQKTLNNYMEPILEVHEKALIFASAAHGAIGQKRKYTGEDYIVHPIAVSNIVKTVEHDQNMIAAALLHDVVEDTSVSIEMINVMFGDDVSHLVSGLTDVSKLEDGNRAFRKEMDRLHSAKGDARIQTIKCADIIHNTLSITEHDKDFAVVYIKEIFSLLRVLNEADRILWGRASAGVAKAAGELDITLFNKGA
jgi:(p)ppGpp synthase/HD superfamily hydrolase